MPYERSLDIEKRLDTVLRLIRTGKYSTPALAGELKVSIPTISRCITALRERGHNIRAEKNGRGWQYILVHSTKTKTRQLREVMTPFAEVMP